MDYYWSTTDSKAIPRKQVEGADITKEYLMNTYNEDSIIT
jgi:hypothetical protein